ncbi:MAG: hypothetical protein R2748_29550 [Bryobacterales bacterium]
MGFDHASRACGAKIVEVGTVDELRKAIGPKTAMLLLRPHLRAEGKISRAGL